MQLYSIFSPEMISRYAVKIKVYSSKLQIVRVKYTTGMFLPFYCIRKGTTLVGFPLVNVNVNSRFI